MTENYPVETLIIEEYNQSIARGEPFNFLKSNAFNSLLSHPEQHILSFLDFDAAFDMCLDYTNKDPIARMIVNKIFCALSIIYNHPKVMITHRSYHKWNDLFQSYYSLDLPALLIHHNGERFLSELDAFFKIDHSTSSFRHDHHLYLIASYCPSFSDGQSKTFLNHADKYLTHYSELIASERHYKFPFSNRRTPEQDYFYTLLGSLTFLPCDIKIIQNHPLYLKFIALPEDNLTICFGELLNVFTLDTSSNTATKPFLSLLFTSPILCSLAFKNGNKYFLNYCDVKAARLSHPEYFF